MESKVQLRKQVKTIRDEIPEEFRISYSQEIVRHILQEPWYTDADTLLVYSAIQSEADIGALCDLAWKAGKHLYFPKVYGENMEFYEVSGWNWLKPGAFHVMEPDVEHMEPEPYTGKDIHNPILVPGVAFSKEGQRLGYGKGYYDRYLMKHPGLIPIGICFEAQLKETIAAEPQDQKMNRIVTECGCYEIGH